MPSPFAFLNLGRNPALGGIARAMDKPLARGVIPNLSREDIVRPVGTPVVQRGMGRFFLQGEKEAREQFLTENIEGAFMDAFGEVPRLDLVTARGGPLDGTQTLLMALEGNMRRDMINAGRAVSLGFKPFDIDDTEGFLMFLLPEDPLVGAAKIGRRTFLKQ